MPFPVSPADGEFATVNGIRYRYSAGNNAWGRLTSGKYTASTSAPGTASPGDHWYNTNDDTLYEYVSDGTNNYWVDIITPTFTANAASSIQAQSWGISAIFGG